MRTVRPEQNAERHIWKHYLLATSLAGGNYILEKICEYNFLFWTQPISWYLAKNIARFYSSVYISLLTVDDVVIFYVT